MRQLTNMQIFLQEIRKIRKPLEQPRCWLMDDLQGKLALRTEDGRG